MATSKEEWRGWGLIFGLVYLGIYGYYFYNFIRFFTKTTESITNKGGISLLITWLIFVLISYGFFGATVGIYNIRILRMNTKRKWWQRAILIYVPVYVINFFFIKSRYLYPMYYLRLFFFEGTADWLKWLTGYF
jgi:hypothetical protein